MPKMRLLLERKAGGKVVVFHRFLSKLSRMIIACVAVFMFSNTAFAACSSNQIDVNGNGTNCQTAKFSVTTTSDATSLSWTMTAIGPFYVDCGDGGNLTQNTDSYGTLSGKTINRTGTGITTYTCTWGSAGAHTVRFGGTATNYGTGLSTTISFYSQAKVASIDGSLGAMFPVVNGNSPRFYQAFSYTQITAIPAGLFSGIDTSSATDTHSMFQATFSGCTNLTQIPAGLFDSIDTSSATNTNNMFAYTFQMCTNLTQIPAGLFDSIDTSKSTSTGNMFRNTFCHCTNLTQIPAGLFDSIDTSRSTSTSYMFSQTFYGCTNLTQIPAGLFDSIDTSSAKNTGYMFQQTFQDCTNLTQIPAGLFTVLDTSSATNTSNMFNDTFRGCTNLTGYIPPTAFPSTIKPGSSSSSDMWRRTFAGTNLATTCPAGTGEYDSGFQNDWGYSNQNTGTDGTYLVSCEPCAGTLPEHATYTAGTCDWTCDDGYYGSSAAGSSSCATCAAGSFCTNGVSTACPIGYTANTSTGKSAITQCTANCAAGKWNGDYTWVEYLESSGTQYIDTGIAPSNNTGFIIDFQYTNSSTDEQIIIGSFDPNFLIDRYSDKFGYAYRGQQGLDESFTMSADALIARHVIELNWQNNGKFRFGDIIRDLPANTFSNSNPIYIFRISGYSGLQTRSGRVYSVKISNNGNLVQHLIPARRNSDNVLGMYDAVTGNFLTNAGSGTFTAGNDVGGIGQCSNVAAGYYSAGGTTAFGTTSTRSTCPSSHPNSAAGASANTDCYKACTTANISHSTAVTGNDYYGAGVDTCEPTGCENGYSVKEGTPNLDPDIEPTDFTANETNKTWDVTAPYGHVTGIATCNTTSGDDGTAYPQYNFEQGTEGQYCWCKMLSPARSAWVVGRAHGPGTSVDGCAEDCASVCGMYVGYIPEFRSAMFGSVTPEPASCAANVITINWGNATAADISANDAGTVTFGGDINTPRAATIIPGKIFRGWKFRNSN